jgi:hypothetical protein
VRGLRSAIIAMVPIALAACTAEVSEALFGPQEESEGPRQVLCFEGYVVSALDRHFIQGVSISLISDNRTWRECITDHSGYYQIRCAPTSYSRTYILSAEKNGWIGQETGDIHYRPDVQRYDFTLEPAGLAPSNNWR